MPHSQLWFCNQNPYVLRKIEQLAQHDKSFKLNDGYFVETQKKQKTARNIETQSRKKLYQPRGRTTLPKLKNSSIHEAAMSMVDTSTEQDGVFMTEYNGKGLRIARNVRRNVYMGQRELSSDRISNTV
jgi:hypothetical protein